MGFQVDSLPQSLAPENKWHPTDEGSLFSLWDLWDSPEPRLRLSWKKEKSLLARFHNGFSAQDTTPT